MNDVDYIIDKWKCLIDTCWFNIFCRDSLMAAYADQELIVREIFDKAFPYGKRLGCSIPPLGTLLRCGSMAERQTSTLMCDWSDFDLVGFEDRSVRFLPPQLDNRMTRRDYILRWYAPSGATLWIGVKTSTFFSSPICWLLFMWA